MRFWLWFGLIVIVILAIRSRIKAAQESLRASMNPERKFNKAVAPSPPANAEAMVECYACKLFFPISEAHVLEQGDNKIYFCCAQHKQQHTNGLFQ